MACTPTDPARLARKIQRRLFWTGAIVNGIAAFALATYLLVIFPPEEQGQFLTRWTGLASTALYLVFASIIGGRLSARLWRRSRAWLATGETPTDKQRRQLLRLPKRLAFNSFMFWLLAVPVMGILPMFDVSVEYGVEVM